MTIAGLIVAFIAASVRLFFWVQGKNNEKLVREEEENKSLRENIKRTTSRPRSRTDTKLMLKKWRDHIGS